MIYLTIALMTCIYVFSFSLCINKPAAAIFESLAINLGCA